MGERDGERIFLINFPEYRVNKITRIERIKITNQEYYLETWGVNTKYPCRRVESGCL